MGEGFDVAARPMTATITPHTAYTIMGKPLMAMHAMLTGHTDWKLEAEGGARMDKPMRVYGKCQCGQRFHVATMTLRLARIGTKGVK